MMIAIVKERSQKMAGSDLARLEGKAVREIVRYRGVTTAQLLEPAVPETDFEEIALLERNLPEEESEEDP